MVLAHDLFCADSPPALTETGDPRARERCVLLLSTMYRAAGLDPFEIGDVWARLAAIRPQIDTPDPAAGTAAVIAMRRLMHADAAQRDTTEPGWTERVAAFRTAGRDLARLAADGRLTRGLRAVLTHHAIFALNRAGTSPHQQAALAWLGHHASFDADTTTAVFTGVAAPTAHNLTRVESTIITTTDPTERREALVTTLTTSGHLRTPEIIAAFRAVERHTFIPDADIETAYLDDAVPIKHDEMISCISAPSIVATQLEQLGARPGHKILEAGAATGYNAALLGRLVTPGGPRLDRGRR